MRIAYRDEFRRRHDNQRVGAFDTPHRLINRLFDGRRLESFLSDDIGNDLGITRGRKNRTFQLQFAPELLAVDNIAVVRQRHAALDMIHDDRLRVAAVIAACCAVAHMSDRHIPLAKLCQDLRGKHIVDQSGIFIGLKDAVIVDHNPTGLLPAMLQGEQSVIGSACYIRGLR